MRSVGIDVHKKDSNACIVDARGRVVDRITVATTREALSAFAKAHLRKSDQVAIEASTSCWSVVKILEPFVSRVVVSNPVETKLIAQSKVKTDKVDAQVLAELLRIDYLPTVWTPDDATVENRRLANRKAALVSDATMIKNRIHAIFHMDMIVPPHEDLFGRQGRAYLKVAELAPLSRMALDSDLRLLEGVERELVLLDKEIAQRSFDAQNVKLVMTIPGIDYTTGFSILSALGDFRRFESAERLASYLGLVPRTRGTGGRYFHGPITKAGNVLARTLLIQSAQAIARMDGPLAAFFQKLKKRRGHNVAIVAVARKLCEIIWHMLHKNEPYRYAKPQSTASKLAKLRVKVTGEKRKGGLKAGAVSTKPTDGKPTRLVPGLISVCQQEGLPRPTAPSMLPSGEKRHLKKIGMSGLPKTLQTDQRVERKACSKRKVGSAC
jgi:transposase